jgi:hypothetical protein
LDIGRVQEGIYDSPYVTKDTNSSFKSQMKYSAWRKDNYYQDTAFSSPQIQSPLSPKLLLRGGDKFDAISGRSTELQVMRQKLLNLSQTFLLRYSILKMSA